MTQPEAEVEPSPAPPPAAAPDPAPLEKPAVTFTPRVEAEEGEPTRFDYVVLVLVTVAVIGALLWAFGIVHIPGLPI